VNGFAAGAKKNTPGEEAHLRGVVYDLIDPLQFKGKWTNRVVCITGSAGTIGTAISNAFAITGAKLALCDYNEDGLKSTAEACKSAGANEVITARCDQTKYEDCKAFVEKVESELGPIHTFVNCAGISGAALFRDGEIEQFQRMMAINFYGPMYFNSLIQPLFHKRKEGYSLNLASRSGTIDYPFTVAYNVSKCAVIRMVGCIQEEIDRNEGMENVFCIALHPGGVVSNMSQQKGQKEPTSLLKAHPEQREFMSKAIKHFKTSAEVCASTCVYLSSGATNDFMRGRYFDCEEDLGDLMRQKELIKKHDMYKLTVDFVGGRPNDGGMYLRDHQPDFKSKLA